MKNLFAVSLLVVASLLSVSSFDASVYATDKEKKLEPTDSFLLKGKGKFTIDGRTYKPFAFNIDCDSEGDCTGSSIDIGNSTVPVRNISYSTAYGEDIFYLGSSFLKCSVYNLGPSREGKTVVFDCLLPYGSGISSDALLDEISTR